ncbi:TPA: replication endonuclease [Pseudomonas aeruginosa]|nr:replication endonuclease [Pseudomonas aeruginosa]HEJ2774755.1 replication endonuclease [Pseudomonas aeruginosa]
MLFIPYKIRDEKAHIDLFFKECENQYFYEQAIEKKMRSKNTLENKNNNSLKRKLNQVAIDIRYLKEKINWVAHSYEYRCWKIQNKYTLDDNIDEVVSNISFVFDGIQRLMAERNINSKFNKEFECSVFSFINPAWNIGYGIKIKDIKGSTMRDKVLNIIDERKLKLQIKRIQKQRSEMRKLEIGLIGSGSNYEICSDELVKSRAIDEAKQFEYIMKKFIVYENGKKVPLSKVASTEKQRFAELFVQVTSLDLYAQKRDYKPLFITFTAPARFHPKPSKGVSSWDGSTPKESNDYLKGLWNAFRKDIHRHKIELSGFWAVEPHKDQCFHKHALMYVKKDQYDKLVDLINKHFKHSENAVRIEEIDTKKSKATSYVMKYLTKSFDMDFKLKDGVLNVDALDVSNHRKVRAVQALWSVRRYAMFGVKNTLSLWRELKRKSYLKGQNANIDKAFSFVENNDFVGFCVFVNGKLKIKKMYAEIEIMKSTLFGSIYTQSLIGKYIFDIETDEVIDIKSKCKIVDASSSELIA